MKLQLRRGGGRGSSSQAPAKASRSRASGLVSASPSGKGGGVQPRGFPSCVLSKQKLRDLAQSLSLGPPAGPELTLLLCLPPAALPVTHNFVFSPRLDPGPGPFSCQQVSVSAVLHKGGRGG